jgi:hypothetical protein
MRVYLPTTLAALPGILAAGALPVPLDGYGVTPALREAYASGDEEELEYVAILAAARESLRLLAADKTAPRRRVVLAADVPDAWVRQSAASEPAERAGVQVLEPVPWSALAAIHVDAAEAEPVVRAAAEAVRAAGQGDEDAQFVLDGAEDESLLWYAVQEADDLLAGPGPAVAEG